VSNIKDGSSNDCSGLTARQTLSNLAGGRTTVPDLVEAALEQACTAQSEINSFALIAYEQARAAAQESQIRYNSGKARRLEGLPITVKDLIDTKALETRYGSNAYIGHVPSKHADVVHLLVEQEAIIIGKTMAPTSGSDLA
jgi:aspartyl-tRNA(Asn)/glutamyl-tRNA(Gln) amidotransferase subunit A